MPSPSKLRHLALPRRQVYVTDSNIVVDAPELVKGKRVVLIEDGPTLTHGGMAYGAGKVGAWGGRRFVKRGGSPAVCTVVTAGGAEGPCPVQRFGPPTCQHSLRSNPACPVRRRKVRRRRDCRPPPLPGGLHAVDLQEAPAPGQAHPRHGLLPRAGDSSFKVPLQRHISCSLY